jgi:hypothetical protein
MRDGRRWVRPPQWGDTVIEGHVCARVLGLRLLELDAHVVVAEVPEVVPPRRAATPGPAMVTAVPVPAVGSDGSRERRGWAGGDADGLDDLPLARARRLLSEGTSVLVAARDLR